MKELPRKIILGLTSLVLLAATFNATATRAFGQIRPAYTKNVDEPGRTPYDKNVVAEAAFGVALPVVHSAIFPAVPLGKRLVLQHVSVFASNFGAPTPATEVAFIAFPMPSGNASDGYKFVIEPDFKRVGAYFFLDRPITLYYEPGAAPRINMFAASGNFTYINITLHGYLIDAVN